MSRSHPPLLMATASPARAAAPGRVLSLDVQQLRYTLNPLEHAQDPMNALQFVIQGERAHSER